MGYNGPAPKGRKPADPPPAPPHAHESWHEYARRTGAAAACSVENIIVGIIEEPNGLRPEIAINGVPLQNNFVIPHGEYRTFITDRPVRAGEFVTWTTSGDTSHVDEPHPGWHYNSLGQRVRMPTADEIDEYIRDDFKERLEKAMNPYVEVDRAKDRAKEARLKKINRRLHRRRKILSAIRSIATAPLRFARAIVRWFRPMRRWDDPRLWPGVDLFIAQSIQVRQP